MPTVSFDAFSKQIKSGSLPPAIYLYGEEDVLKEEAVRAMLDQVVDPGLRDFNYDQRNASQLDPEAVETLCNTLPMMADRRLVVIREIEAWQKRARAKAAILHYLEHPAAETVLVLVQGAPRRDDDRVEADPEVLRLTCAVEVPRYGARLAEKWVLKRGEERGIVLAPEAAAHLVKAVAGDLGAARSELDKLAGLGGAEPVTLEQVTQSLGVRHGETQADWCDAVLEDHSGRAASILPHLLSQSGVSGVALLTQLGTQLLGVGLARALYDRRPSGAARPGCPRAWSARSVRPSCGPGRPVALTTAPVRSAGVNWQNAGRPRGSTRPSVRRGAPTSDSRPRPWPTNARCWWISSWRSLP